VIRGRSRRGNSGKNDLEGFGGMALTAIRSAAGRLVPGWEANEVRWVGLRIMSGANTYSFWSVKSLLSGMERSGMEDDNL